MVKLLRVPVPSSTRMIGWPPTPFCRNANGSLLSGTASFLMISVPDAGVAVAVGVLVGGTAVLVGVFVAVGVAVSVGVLVAVLVGVFVGVAVGAGVLTKVHVTVSPASRLMVAVRWPGLPVELASLHEISANVQVLRKNSSAWY